MRPSPAKYLFDNDFAAGRETKPTLSIVEHTAKLAEVEAASYRKGFADAAAEARASVEERTAVALERIAGLLEEISRGLSAVEARLETETIDVAVAVAKKLAHALIAREPLAEISALAVACFQHLVAAPHIAVLVNDADYPAAGDKLQAIVRSRGLDSRLVVLAEPCIAPGDCRIEWADGGVIRDRAATEAAIDEAVVRYVHARLEAAGPKALHPEN
jgi:flagellar assembly protein FliH